MTTKKKKSSEVTRLPINDANEVHFQTCVSQQQQRHLANELENKVWRIFAQGLTTLDLQFLFLPWLGRVGFAKLNLVTRPKKMVFCSQNCSDPEDQKKLLQSAKMFKSVFCTTSVLETGVDPASRFCEFETLFPTSKLCKTLI